jgi:hypothetical protein
VRDVTHSGTTTTHRILTNNRYLHSLYVHTVSVSGEYEPETFCGHDLQRHLQRNDGYFILFYFFLVAAVIIFDRELPSDRQNMRDNVASPIR